MKTRVTAISLGILLLWLGAVGAEAGGLEFPRPGVVFVPRPPPVAGPRWFPAAAAAWPCLRPAPSPPLYGSLGPGAPRFHWGYFGAGRYRHAVSHTTYYGDSFQWSFRWE